MNTPTYATTKQVAWLREKIFNLEKQNVELTNNLVAKIKDADEELARIKAVFDRADALLATVAKLRAEYPVARARDRVDASLEGLL